MTRPSTLERAARFRRREDRRLVLHFAIVTLLVGSAAPLLGPWAALIPLAFLPELLGVGVAFVLVAVVLGVGQACVLAPRLATFRGYVVGTVVAGAPALWLFLRAALGDDGTLAAILLAVASGLLLGLGQALALRPRGPALAWWCLSTVLGATAAWWLLRHPYLRGEWSPLFFFLGPAAALAASQTPALAVLLAANREDPAATASAG